MMRTKRTLRDGAAGSLAALGLLLSVVQACGDGGTSDGSELDGGAGGVSGAAGEPSTGVGGTLLGVGGTLVNPTGGSSGSGNGGGGGEDCGGDRVDASPVPANLLLVIDRSQSMNGAADGFDTDKWTTLVGALEDSLSNVDGQMSVGLQFFPDAREEDALGCGIPTGGEPVVPVATNAVDAVVAALNDDMNAPAGNTPTAAALQLALDYFTDGGGAGLEGERYVLLAVDGGPNCNSGLTCDAAECTLNIDGVCPSAAGNCCAGGEEQQLSCMDDAGAEAAVAALADAGIKTFVIGIPGSDLPEYETVLDALADAGGLPAQAASPKFYRVEDADQLGETLGQLTVSLVTECTLQLDASPPDRGEVNVFIDDQVVPRSGDDGWTLTTDSPPSVVLLGATCERIEQMGASSVRIEFGCPTVE